MALTRRNPAVSLFRPAALAIGCTSLLLAACSGMGDMGSSGNMPPTVKVTNGVLTDPQGLTLYTFDRDAGGKSMCNGQCAANWPPLMAAPGTSPSGSYSIIGRDDGSRQWAYKGKPLYRFSRDAKPGDKSGDNFNNVWHVAAP